MKLTPAQKHLIHWLKIMGMSLEETLGVMLLLDTPERRDKMMEWMSRNPNAIPSDLIGVALGIVKEI